MEVKAAALRCQLLFILLMSAVMLLPATNGSLLLVQRIVTRTIVLQETIGKDLFLCHPASPPHPLPLPPLTSPPSPPCLLPPHLIPILLRESCYIMKCGLN
ncbi:hypothetical protein STEG23_022113 [Scotinomys teguina]